MVFFTVIQLAERIPRVEGDPPLIVIAFNNSNHSPIPLNSPGTDDNHGERYVDHVPVMFQTRYRDVFRFDFFLFKYKVVAVLCNFEKFWD